MNILATRFTVFAMALILATCCAARRTPKAQSQAGGAELVITALKSDGLDVRDGGTIEQPFLTARGRVVVANGQDVQIYAYGNAAKASKEAADSARGGMQQIRWIAPPHFFQKDRLLVISLGANEAVLKSLAKILGAELKRP